MIMILMMAMMQVMEWMDLERNAAILEKTDKAIAQKLRAASGGKVIVHGDFWSDLGVNFGVIVEVDFCLQVFQAL